MPLSGQTVAQQMMRAFQDAQDELKQARLAAASTEHEIEEIRSDRDRTLAELAKHYLPSLTRETLLQTWSEVRQSIEQVLLKKESHIRQLEEELDQLETKKRSAEGELETNNGRLDTVLDKQQTVAEELSSVLAKDASFIELTQRAAEAEAALERAEASLEQVEHDSNQKLPAYENSRLFMYLYRRGLATPTYTGRGFTRRMDRRVGRLIDYPKAKIGYEYLRSTPQLVRSLVTRDRDSLAVVMGELESRRDEEAEKLGLHEIVIEVQQAEADREETLAKLEQVRERTDAARTELADIERADGPYYQQAINFFKSVLAQSDRETLESRARRTPDPLDDQIVSSLKRLDAKTNENQTEVNALQQRVEWLDRHLAELGSLQQRFRSSHFDSARSTFDGSFDLQHDLNLVRKGSDTIDNVWNRLRRSQRVAPSPLEGVGSGLAGAASHPLTQVLIHAMANAATGAMSDHARRAGGRHINSRKLSSTDYGRKTSSRGVGSGSQNYGNVRQHQPKSKPDRDGGFFTIEKF